MKLFFRYKHIILLLMLTFLAVKPLIHQGLPPTHDGEYHIIRFYEFDKALRDGDWYPRWAYDLNNGYGIPLFNYVYPLPNYVASLLYTFGIGFIDGFKMSLLLATVVGVLFFYFWTKLFFDKIAAVTAAIFYAFSPYRFVDIYVRGSVGEVWALAFFPAFLWAVTLLMQKRKIPYVVLAAIFFALTIFSHNIVGLMFAVFGFIYTMFLFFICTPTKKMLLASLSVFILGVCLSAIFWLPALGETSFVKNLQLYNVDDHFPEIYQLLIPSWGTGFSGKDLGNQMSFQIGTANLLAVCAAFFLFLRSWKARDKNKNVLIFFVMSLITVVCLMLNITRPIWHFVPLLNYFQFPWRFLSLVILICSFIAGAVISMINGKKRKVSVSIIFIFLAVTLSLSYTQPAYYHQRSDAHYLTRENFIHGTNSQGDMFNTIWIAQKPPLKKSKVEIVQGKGIVVVHNSKTSLLTFSVMSDEVSQIVVNTAYFPGWEVYIDGEKILVQKTRIGSITFPVSKGEHSVVVHFNDTMIRRVGVGISFFGLVVCLGMLLLRKKLEKLL